MTNYQYTDWMAQFTENDRQLYVEIAKKGFQNLTQEETTFLNNWNAAKAVFGAEIAEALATMRSEAAIASANSIAARTASIAAIQTLEQQAIENYERSIGIGGNNEQPE